MSNEVDTLEKAATLDLQKIGQNTQGHLGPTLIGPLIDLQVLRLSGSHTPYKYICECWTC